MASTNNNKTSAGHVVLSVLISSTFLLAIVENQNLYALTSEDRYTSGFSRGEQQATIDFQNNIPFNPVRVEHTSYYCAGYVNGYNVTWKVLAKEQTSNPSPNPYASNSTSTSPAASNTNTTATNPSTIISPPRDSLVAPFIIFVILLLIAEIAWKIAHRKEKYKVRQAFPDLVKEKVLDRQHHRCADCSRVLNVVDWHHRNGDRSDNRVRERIVLHYVRIVMQLKPARIDECVAIL